MKTRDTSIGREGFWGKTLNRPFLTSDSSLSLINVSSGSFWEGDTCSDKRSPWDESKRRSLMSTHGDTPQPSGSSPQFKKKNKNPKIKCSFHANLFYRREMKNVGGLSAGDFFFSDLEGNALTHSYCVGDNLQSIHTFFFSHQLPSTWPRCSFPPQPSPMTLHS